MNRRAVTRRLRCEEHGVVLVMVAMLMTVFIASAALAIDLGSFDGAQRQAQAAADAGALAGAQDLPTTGTASTDASSYANMNAGGLNNLSITPVVSSTQVKVTVTATTPAFFGQFLGITNANVTATATAGKTATSSPCTAAGSINCAVLFAMDTNCAHNGISITAGSISVNGSLISNGSASSTAGSGAFNGPVYYGTGTGCQWNQGGGGYTFASQPAPQAPSATWPIDYSTDFPACSGAACTGPCTNGQSSCATTLKTPKFCTVTSSATPVSFPPSPGNIYCAVGTGSANTPSTWNGAMTVTSASSNDTYVGGSWQMQGGGESQSACGYNLSSGYQASACNSTVTPVTKNYPLIYVTGTGTPCTLGGGGETLTGDIFAPNGTINVTAGSAVSTFLEALDIIVGAGSIQLNGTGPSSSGSGSSGGVTLLQ